MTPKQEAAMRQARECLAGVLRGDYDGNSQEVIAAIDEALSEQQSGIKQVIELYDSPEQPAQQDYWQKEARRYAQNAEFWRGKYEDATAQQPVEWGVDWGKAGDQSCVSIIKRLPGGGIEVLATEYGPPASKPWVGLTEEEIDECYYWKGRQWTTDELVRHVEAKLREKNNG